VSHDDDQEGSVALLTGHSAMTKTARKRARIMASLGEVTRTRSVYFTETDAKTTSVDGTAIVSHRELATFREPDEVREVIRERTEDPLEV
jgi:putative transcriptional regulator